MANYTLSAFLKKYLTELKSNTEYRQQADKLANFYLQENMLDLISQIEITKNKAERDFKNNYEQALKALQQKGLSNATFARISGTLRKTFLDNFVSLKDVGIETGHVFSNLTTASKEKALSVFKTEYNFSEYTNPLTKEDTDNLSKAIALIFTYIDTIENLDRIQNRKDLLKFLKKAPEFKSFARKTSLTNLEEIGAAISAVYSTNKKSKGFADLGRQLLSSSIVNIEQQTLVDMTRKITASEDKIALTFEVGSFNKFKGTIAASIKNAFTNLLDQMISDPNALPKIYNDALKKAVKTELTKENIKDIFPNVSASKTLKEAVTDIYVSILSGKKVTVYNSSKKAPQQKITNNIKLTSKNLKLNSKRIVNPGSPSSIRGVADKQINLTSLQNLLNANLVNQVKKNMGNGTRSDVLNLQTGRFAESVEVTRLSESRQGMITAFYTYMKNPYATFSAGGRQEFPTSRDPKTLIAKSIREIAAEQVSNRLRSVLV